MLGPAASAEAARQSVDAGFVTLKLKAGAERETEVLVDRVRAVREAIGPDVHLRLDVNGAWDPPTAEERLEAVERFRLEYVEQPLAGDDAEALAELRRRVRVPIAADESVTSVKAARELLDAEAVDVLVVKPARVGGLVVGAEIAALAAERGVPVVVSTLFETGVGIAAALAMAARLPEVVFGGPGRAARPRAGDGGPARARPVARRAGRRGRADVAARRAGSGRARDRGRRRRGGPLSRRSRGGRVTGAAWSAPDLVRRHAARAGDEPAIIVGSDVVTWAGLDGRVDALAGELRSSGVPEGGVVAFTGEPTVETVVRVLAVLRAGGVAASLPVALTAAERAVATHVLVPVITLGSAAGLATGGRRLDEAGVVVLTSGTTARPKGVVLSERALAASADAWLAALPPATGWLLALGLGHVAGLGVLWRAIASGVPMRIADGLRPAALADAIAVARGQPRVARPDAARPPARRRRRRTAAGQPPRGAAGRRDRPGGARDPGDRRRLARGPDLRPQRGGLRRDRAPDRGGA